MATSIADICNIALLRIGQSQLITDMEDNSTAARACSAVFGTALRSVLSRVAWRFAEGEATLAVLDEDDVSFSEWDLAYSLPADCLKPRYIYSGDRNPGRDSKIPYGLKYSSFTEGKVLVTDLEDAVLVYTVLPDETNLAIYPDLFVDALAWRIAVDLALGVAKKPAVAQVMSVQYQVALGLAAADDLNQMQPDPEPDSELITCR